MRKHQAAAAQLCWGGASYGDTGASSSGSSRFGILSEQVQAGRPVPWSNSNSGISSSNSVHTSNHCRVQHLHQWCVVPALGWGGVEVLSSAAVHACAFLAAIVHCWSTADVCWLRLCRAHDNSCSSSCGWVGMAPVVA
jgi:hypothetical protein